VSAEEKFETWALVELFGHQQIVGVVTEQAIGGCSFIRVDVPAANGAPAYTKFYGNGAVYSMTPVGEAEARAMMERLVVWPISPYLLPAGAGKWTDMDDEDMDNEDEADNSGEYQH